MIIGISGSPFPEGNTDRLVRAVLHRSGDKTDFVNLSTLRFDSCRACAHLCAATNICPLEDDLRPYFEPIRDADAIVLGTPIHAGLITGWMYSFLTRLSCFSHVRHPLAKKPVILVTTGCFAKSIERATVGFADIVVRQTRGANIGGQILHATSIPPCFECGEGNECKVGGLWRMVGGDEERLKSFEVTPESFTRWEDNPETVAQVEVSGSYLSGLSGDPRYAAEGDRITLTPSSPTETLESLQRIGNVYRSGKMMTDKERVHAVMQGDAIDRMPVHASYTHLYQMDHFDELTGLPRHHYKKWLYSPAEEFLSTFATILDAAPFDIVQPPARPSAIERKSTRFLEKDGKPFLYHEDEDRLEAIPLVTKSGHGTDDHRANEEQIVFSPSDIDEKVRVVLAESRLAGGAADELIGIVEALGDTRFVMTGGVVGTIYSCGQWLGQTNLFLFLLQEPELVEYLCNRITEQNIETIRVLAHAGGDAIFIDDATATSDMISPQMYERFSLPYMKRMVAEIKSHGHKAVVIYFGGVSDRLDKIAEIGADVLNMETSMKSYINDLGTTAKSIGDRMTLCMNLNPYEHIQLQTDEGLESIMRQQAEAGMDARGLIACSASPITMKTPLSRVRKFIELGRSMPVVKAF